MNTPQQPPPEGAEYTNLPQQQLPPDGVEYAPRGPMRLTRDDIVRRTVIDVRSADIKSKLRSDQCRAMRINAEKLADRIEDLDRMTQEIVIGMTAHRGGIPEGAMLDGYIDEASRVSEAFRAPQGPWLDQYGRDQGERPSRLIELMWALMVRTRSQMDPKTRLAAPGCKTLRDRCHKLAESLLEYEPEIQDAVVAFCVRGGIAEGSQLASHIDQARLLINALHETYPPPLPPAHP
jgi:hypothetical protein